MHCINQCKVYEVKEQELKEITGKGFEIKFRKLHYLKILEEFADAVLTGDKTFELRYNDRNYKTGDLIIFQVINDNGQNVPNHKLNGIRFQITYMLADWGLQHGYVALGIKQTPFRLKPEPIKGYICDPKKNKECAKTACYERGGLCCLTLNPEYAKEPSEEKETELDEYSHPGVMSHRHKEINTCVGISKEEHTEMHRRKNL